MKFSQAIDAAHNGHKIARSGWNGRNMWVAYMIGFDVTRGQLEERLAHHLGTAAPATVRIDGYFGMWTAQGTWQIGWLASQADMSADDWCVVE